MDIKLERKRSRFSSRQRIAGGFAAVLAVGGYLLLATPGTQKVPRDSLLIGTVQQGPLEVFVEGYGTLRSDKQKLLTSQSAATVEEIVLKTGSDVTVDSVILRLANPELIEEAVTAERNLWQQQAALRQLILNNSRELMAQDAELAELQADYETAQYRRMAQEELVESGIVSKLDYNTTKLRERQLNERVAIFKGRRAQLLLIQQEAVHIQQERINETAGLHKASLDRVDRLTIRASIDGVLQSLSVNLGQSVIAGQALGVVGSSKDLVALVRVPQTRAQHIKPGQQAVLDTRTEKTRGMVTRIDPVVQDGSVTVEVAFADAVPTSARPELSVTGRILTDRIQDALFVERPVNVAENTTAKLFKLSSNARSAMAVDLNFGIESGRFLQIVSGISAGEKLILSDTRRLDPSQKILVQ